MARKPRGRPPIGDEAASARVTVRVTAAQRLQLRRVATSNRIAGGMSGVLREAVGEFVADCEERRLFRRG